MKVNLTFNQQEKTTVEIRKVIISSNSRSNTFFACNSKIQL